MTTYTVDLFSTLDGYGSGRVAYWGKEGPELVEQRAQAYGNKDQTLVFGANTYRLFQKFAPAEDDPSHAPLNEAQKIVISRTLEEPLTWENSTLIAEDALKAVPRRRQSRPSRSAPAEASQPRTPRRRLGGPLRDNGVPRHNRVHGSRHDLRRPARYRPGAHRLTGV
jgi:hypothetical protein